jgi:hypothetical protein
MPSEPYQSLAGFITSIPSRCPARDRVFADHKGFGAPDQQAIADTACFGHRLTDSFRPNCGRWRPYLSFLKSGRSAVG